MKIAIKFKPEGLALGDKPKFLSATDGDTPTISVPIRMLGMDTPELHFAGASEKNPGKFDKAFDGFLKSPAGKKLNPGLRAYLAKRLKSKASTRHIQAGLAAYEHFETSVASRLKRISESSGKELTPRRLFTMVSKQVFDRYGRMLAYVAPSYTKEERDTVPAKKRPTFNLQLMQDGHASSLIIYPNIPKPADLKLVHDAIKTARQYRRGFWRQSTPLLEAFEFRWIADTYLGNRGGPSRFCGDFETAVLYPPQLYYNVPHERRVWFFEENVGNAYEMGFTLAY